jgi:hypothetical protein
MHGRTPGTPLEKGTHFGNGVGDVCPASAFFPSREKLSALSGAMHTAFIPYVAAELAFNTLERFVKTKIQTTNRLI